VKYEDPLLVVICGFTYGVMIYQEQVQNAAKLLAGYTLGGADILRRAMGKKKASVMDAQRQTFVKGAKETNDIDARLRTRFSTKLLALPDTDLTNPTLPVMGTFPTGPDS